MVFSAGRRRTRRGQHARTWGKFVYLDRGFFRIAKRSGVSFGRSEICEIYDDSTFTMAWMKFV